MHLPGYMHVCQLRVCTCLVISMYVSYVHALAWLYACMSVTCMHLPCYMHVCQLRVCTCLVICLYASYVYALAWLYACMPVTFMHLPGNTHICQLRVCTCSYTHVCQLRVCTCLVIRMYACSYVYALAWLYACMPVFPQHPVRVRCWFKINMLSTDIA